MTFAAPLFLVAALAAIIPLLLHLMNRQQAPVLPFSTLRFLRLSVQRTRRRKYLYDVLLLALRIAALILVAVGLAQPAVSQFGHLLGQKPESAVVLIVDNSGSMGARDVHENRWDVARQAAEQVLNNLGEADSVGLLLTSGPPRPELDQLHANHEIVRTALDAAVCRPERADLAGRLQRAEELLAAAQAPNKEIYIVTDLQANAWASLPADLPNPTSAPKPPIVLLDVKGEPVPNASVTSLDFHSAGPVVGVPMQVTATVTGDASVEQQRHAELILNGQTRGTSPALPLAPRSTVQSTFSFTVDRPGVHRGVVRLVGEDSNPLDDECWFAVTVQSQIPVAVVTTRRHEIPYLDDAYYLQRALVPVTEQSWAIQTTALTADELESEDLARYAVVFCVNLPALGSTAARRLHEYVRRGGSLVWTCGDNVDPPRYEAMNAATDHQLLPLAIGPMREAGPDHPDGWHIGSLDASHTALGALTEPNSVYRSVLVSRHLQLLTGPTGEVRVLAALDDHQPLLVERRVGAGTVLLLGTSVHVDWSDLPLRPLFLPLVARLSFYLAGTQTTRPSLVAGTPLVLPMPANGAVDVKIGRPTGEVVSCSPPDGGALLRYSDTYDVGVYEVMPQSPAESRPFGVAVNGDDQECDAEYLSPESLRGRIGSRPFVFWDKSADLAETIRRLREGESVREWFLLAVLMALIAESGVANWRTTRERGESPLAGPARLGRRRSLPERFEPPVLYR